MTVDVLNRFDDFLASLEGLALQTTPRTHNTYRFLEV